MRKARTFDSFARHLFPGDVVDFVPNSDDLPEDVVTVLEKIADDTRIPYDWLEKTAGLVVDGLAGLQCLWFLHGVGGTIRDSTLGGYGGEPRLMIKALAVERDRRLAKLRQRDPSFFALDLVTDWGNGTVEERQYKIESDYPYNPRKRIEKIGKLINKLDLDDEKKQDLRHMFETRELPEWEWRISTHPYDILTMSYNRPWKSCMRPESGFNYQYGILTDLAAGSAMLFFYRPGADAPCGRLTLRPSYSKEGLVLLSGKTIYGDGPKHFDREAIEALLRKETKLDIRVIETNLCRAGGNRTTLSRDVYDDNSRAGCSQSDSDYKAAYERLQQVAWPPPTLELEEGLRLAADYVGELSCSTSKGNDIDISGWADWYVENYGIGRASLEELTEVITSQDHPDFDNAIMDQFDLSFGDEDENVESLMEALSESFMLVQEATSRAITEQLVTTRVYFLGYRTRMDSETKEDLEEAKAARAVIYTFDSSRYSYLADSAQELLGLTRSERSRALFFGPEDPRQLELDLGLAPIPCPLAFMVLVDENHEAAWDALCEDYEDEVPPLVQQAHRIAYFVKGSDVEDAVIASLWNWAREQ